MKIQANSYLSGSKLTFSAVALKVLLGGNEMGSSGVDLGGIFTAIALDPTSNCGCD